MNKILKRTFIIIILLPLLLVSGYWGYWSFNQSKSYVVKESALPKNYFKIKVNTSKNLDVVSANRVVDVFGLKVYAKKEVSNKNLLHAANVLAQYLDNDEDGKIDNEKVYQKLLEKQNVLFLSSTKKPGLSFLQALHEEEIIPGWYKNKSLRFDATLEEVWHVMTTSGYSLVYLDELGETETSQLAKAMDIARGGKFVKIPASYPTNAWYTYDDKTCSYTKCQTAEYIYWLMSSYLGAQKDRLSEIENEWKLNTRAKIEARDKAGWAIITDPKYKFPKVLPDGSYNPTS